MPETDEHQVPLKQPSWPARVYRADISFYQLQDGELKPKSEEEIGFGLSDIAEEIFGKYKSRRLAHGGQWDNVSYEIVFEPKQEKLTTEIDIDVPYSALIKSGGGEVGDFVPAVVDSDFEELAQRKSMSYAGKLASQLEEEFPELKRDKNIVMPDQSMPKLHELGVDLRGDGLGLVYEQSIMPFDPQRSRETLKNAGKVASAGYLASKEHYQALESAWEEIREEEAGKEGGGQEGQGGSPLTPTIGQ